MLILYYTAIPVLILYYTANSVLILYYTANPVPDRTGPEPSRTGPDRTGVLQRSGADRTGPDRIIFRTGPDQELWTGISVLDRTGGPGPGASLDTAKA